MGYSKLGMNGYSSPDSELEVKAWEGGSVFVFYNPDVIFFSTIFLFHIHNSHADHTHAHTMRVRARVCVGMCVHSMLQLFDGKKLWTFFNVFSLINARYFNVFLPNKNLFFFYQFFVFPIFVVFVICKRNLKSFNFLNVSVELCLQRHLSENENSRLIV